MSDSLSPDSAGAVTAVLAAAAAGGQSVRISGAGTKQGWAAGGAPETDIRLSTLALDRIVAHHRNDMIATVGAGISLATLQRELSASSQMLALDPPHGERATVGGIFASGDCGPLAHRFGTPRDQILAMTVALADGSVINVGAGVARGGPGYGLPRLFCGSFGTLGVIVTLTVKLVPRAEQTATALAVAADPAQIAAAATALSAAPLELGALDVAWRNGRGGLLAQCAGAGARHRAGRAAALMGAAGLTSTEVTDEDTALWASQRAGQRSRERALIRLRARPSQLPAVLALADRCGARLTGRAALGVSYLELEPARLGELRLGLPAGSDAQLLDHPAGGVPGAELGRWGMPDGALLELTRRIKARFDPADVCNRGIRIDAI